MDCNNYSYAPHMLDEARGEDQDMSLCVECEKLEGGECGYLKASCDFKAMEL